MDSSQSTTCIPLGIQQRIDACCQRFEQHWINGLKPGIEEFVAEADVNWRAELLRELLAIELSYRKSEFGHPLTDSEICDLHPDLKPEILVQLRLFRDANAPTVFDSYATPQRLVTPVNSDSTFDHHSPHQRSRGLHIRCPHCDNPVELVNDTPYESIVCITCGSAFSLVGAEGHTAEAPILQKLGRFEVVARLGVGGFGTVWKARDIDLNRVVAIKIPRKGQLNRAEVEQFLREARTAAQLRHPNIVPVHEVGREGDTVFIVSDLVRGVSLSDWLSGDPPSCEKIAEVTATIADAVDCAHQQGVIHRDLKPSNILIDEHERPYVMDFGLAKRELGEITMTVDGQVLGTPAYMSPEQARGDSHWTDRRTDIYSLGVVLFRMLTGELPFRGNSQLQIHQRLTKDPPDPRSLNRFIPRDLSTICLKCIESNPNLRFSTARELAEELRRYLSSEPILSRPISSIERGLRWAKRKPLMAATIGLVLLLAIAGPIVALVIKRQLDHVQVLLAENDNLIDRYRNETELADGKNTELQRQLDVWEGRANPWEFWPPSGGQAPRQNLVSGVLAHANATLPTKLRAGSYSLEKTVRGYLCLAILANAEGVNADARQYYELARDALIKLRKDDPDQPRFAQALAECYMQLARLAGPDKRDEATKDVEAARAIHSELAAQYKTAATYQIGWLEAELSSAMMAGFETGQGYLKRVDEISRELPTKWPSDPNDLYGLACFLTECKPILSTSDAVEPTKRDGSSIDSPKD